MPETRSTRAIGRWGTTARLVGGAASLVLAVVVGLDEVEFLLGLAVFPLAVTGALAMRGRSAPPLRLDGPMGCCLVVVAGGAAFTFVPAAAFLFFGASALLAAARGDVACEVFAVANWLNRRDDQIACPLFGPIDRAESDAARRSVV